MTTGLSQASTVTDALDAWLYVLGTKKPSEHTLAAYRRDVQGVSRRLAAGPLCVADLTRPALRAAFASWAADHAAASVLRAHAAWSGFFDFLVEEQLAPANPMPAIAKPRRGTAAPRAIKAPDAARRLLAAAAEADPRARDPWPERDLAVVATFCVTGIRAGEAVKLTIGSLDGVAGARRLQVDGKGGHFRAIPIEASLEAVLERYLASRAARFPRHRLDHPATVLFVDRRGRALSASQVKYLIERLYTRAGVRAWIPAGAHVHALRHSFATNALRAGADVVELQTLLGHVSLETTRRYLDASAERIRQVVHNHPSELALREHLGRHDDPARR